MLSKVLLIASMRHHTQKELSCHTSVRPNTRMELSHFTPVTPIAWEELSHLDTVWSNDWKEPNPFVSMRGEIRFIFSYDYSCFVTLIMYYFKQAKPICTCIHQYVYLAIYNIILYSQINVNKERSLIKSPEHHGSIYDLIISINIKVTLYIYNV